MLPSNTAALPAPDQSPAGAGPPNVPAGAPSAQGDSLIRKAAREFASTPADILLASFFVNLLALALPLTLQQIYDRILPNAALNTLAALLMSLFAVVVFDITLRILRDSLISHSALAKAFRGRVRAFATLLFAEPRRVREKSGRFWLDRMAAVEDIANVKDTADKTLFIDLPFVFIFLGMVALIGGWLVFAPIALIVIISVVMLSMSRRQRAFAEERREEDEKRYAQIGEWLGGISTIKLLAMETQIIRRFEGMLSKGVAYSYHAVLQNNQVPLLGQLFSNLMMVTVSTVGAVRVIEGSMSIGSLACCSLLATRVAQPVFRVLSVAAQMRSIALVQARASAITDLPLNPPAAEEGPPITGRIELIDVTLPPRPGGSGSFLRSLNLVMEPGEIVGIAGPARSGKTAVLSLIDGMLEPQSGRVLIDGLDVTSPQIRAQRRRIQRISGRIAIFRGTILENVAMFRSGVHIGEAVAAMETIGLDAQINKLPEGYDTPIGDGAQIVLPHGFQQALMIARALAQRPAILLVAEVGALLDIDNYRRLERALRRMPNRPTTILASQRGSVFAVADRVFEIREGVLHALGEIAAPEATADEGDASPASASLGGVKQA